MSKMKGFRKIGLLFPVIFWLFIWGCSSTNRVQSKSAGHFGDEPRGGLDTLVILGTNDLHGALAPQSLKTRELPGVESIPYLAGGASVLASYVKILRNEFSEHFLWLDAGDEFQGSIESNAEEGAPVVQFLNKAGLSATAIGNHDFDFGLGSLKKRMAEAHFPYLAANILQKSTGKLASFPNTLPYQIFSAGKLKVGVIGLSTLETSTKTKFQNVKSLEFQDLKEATLKEAQALRDLGAHIIVITAHAGLECTPGNLPETRLIRKPTDIQGECGDHDEIVRLLQSLPAGTIDAVVSGHTHKVVHHWIAGVPVIQGGAFGRYLNVIYLTYDWSQRRVIHEQTRIEGPVPVCAQVFQHQNDCNGDRPAPKAGRGPLVPYKFHGEIIHPDQDIESLLEPTLKKSENIRNRILGMAARTIDFTRNKENSLGNLVADAVRNITHADFALVNLGGMRASIEQGPITYESVFRALPFDNAIAVLRVNQRELSYILRVAENGSRGFPPISGLQLRLIDPAYEAPSVDLVGDGKEEPWKVNRLVDFTLSSGEPLDPQKYYTLATIDFLVTGGDNLGWPMSQLPAEHVTDTGILVREALVKYIEKKKSINSEEDPLYSPEKPRLKFEKPVFKGSHKKSKRKGRRRRAHPESS